MGEEDLPDEPDIRILQANERTLLAWIRTGLALMAFGFVLARVGAWLRAEGEAPGNGGWWLGATFVLLGTLCNSSAALRYWRIHRALIQGRHVVPGSAVAVSLAVGVTILGLLLGAYVLIR
ncbi:MAG: DUF202 domain-containing protein [Deltaproteobacteria bacterium]|nr:DUF202 domain-containing protein [Deltaproteobacteria bacterium]